MIYNLLFNLTVKWCLRLLQVMGTVGFNFPIFLTLIHYVIAWFLLAIFKALSVLPVSPPSKTTPFSSLFSLGVVMSLSSGLANTSLKYNRSISYSSIFLLQVAFFSPFGSFCCSVGFYQMAKIAVTPSIVVAEFIIFKKTISSTKVTDNFFHFLCYLLYTLLLENSSRTYVYLYSNHLKKCSSFEQVLALVVVSIGVAVATVTDLEFNLFGALIATAWIIPSAINKILWSNLQQQGNWTALALVFSLSTSAKYIRQSTKLPINDKIYMYVCMYAG